MEAKCEFCALKVESVTEAAIDKKIAKYRLETHVEYDHPAEWQEFLANGGQPVKLF